MPKSLLGGKRTFSIVPWQQIKDLPPQSQRSKAPICTQDEIAAAEDTQAVNHHVETNLTWTAKCQMLLKLGVEQAVTGDCVLAVLGDGQISGYVMPSDQGNPLGLHVEELIGGSECMREPGWRLCKATVIDYVTGDEVCGLLCRTGADNVRLAACHTLQSSEMEAVVGHIQQLEYSLTVDFECSTIKDTPDSEPFLASFFPQLMPYSPLVNLGTATITTNAPTIISRRNFGLNSRNALD